MKIKVTIKPKSKAAQAFKKYMAEKDAFRKAVKSGDAFTYAKQRPIKFDAPI